MTQLLPRSSCRHCRRPIAFVEGVGWLHDELPKYAHEPITCESAQPLPGEDGRR